MRGIEEGLVEEGEQEGDGEVVAGEVEGEGVVVPDRRETRVQLS